MVSYTTPNMGGLTATLGTILAGNNGGNAKTEMNVIYKAGPLAAALGYDKTSGGKKSTTIGGSYNLGVAKVAVAYYDPAVSSKGFSIGASAPMGPVSVAFDIAKATEGAKDTDYVLEAKYSLSKRTFAYGVLHREGAEKVNTFGVGVRHNF
jgi:predicted porin